MPDHEDSLGGETFSGEEQQDPAEQSLVNSVLRIFLKKSWADLATTF
jgi:hypothetical protein